MLFEAAIIRREHFGHPLGRQGQTLFEQLESRPPLLLFESVVCGHAKVSNAKQVVDARAWPAGDTGRWSNFRDEKWVGTERSRRHWIRARLSPTIGHVS